MFFQPFKFNTRKLFLSISLITSFAIPSLIKDENKYKIFDKFNFWKSKLLCLDTIRTNKPQIIKLMSQSTQQVLLLIYNRESQSQLKDKIIKCEQIAQKLGVKKVALIDQTDVRHLQTFSRILREDIDEQENKKQTMKKQPINLQGKIRIMYINPLFDTNKPFQIQNQQSISDQIIQIRKLIKINPSEQELKKSIQTFNRTTVVKNCYNETCVAEYKQKIRQMIDVELLRDKSDNFSFFVSTSKNQANKISSVINQTSNKQEIYIFKNDMLGKQRKLFTQFLEKQGQNYQNQSKLMMAIKPRVHILSKRSLNTDLYWFITCLKANPVPIFSINNTAPNLPVKIIEDEQIQEKQKKQQIQWMKGIPQQIELIKKIKAKYDSKVQILIIQTTLPSQLIRHSFQPERYCIFKLSPNVPYPKLLIKPPVLSIYLKYWEKMQKVKQSEILLNNKATANNLIQSDVEKYDQKWQDVLENVEKFVGKPINYSTIKLYAQKQLQINAQNLKQMLQGKGITDQHKNKWIFRICGNTNNCLYSAYQKYGLDINVPVYKLDGNVQNVNLQQADYIVQNNQVKQML